MKYWGLYLALSFLSFLSFHLSLLASAAQCGKKAGGAVCPKGLCCSQYGWCGTTNDYCGDGCQSQCNHGSGRSGSGGTTTHTDIDGCGAGGDDVVDGGTGSGGISSLISSSMFDEMFKHRNDGDCPGKGFYTYDAFIEAAKAYPAFGNTGDYTTRKREIAAFLAQTSHETTGGGSASEDGQFAWGFCYLEEQNPPSAYCDKSDKNHKCAPGKRYYGRGPIQLSWNYNYGPCGEALGVDLLNNPGLLITDPVISFKSALWFWMSATSRGPTCHEAITWKWSSMSMADRVKGGFGMVTNLINGPLECGKGSNEKVQDRIGYYKRYCDMLGISYGNNLDC